MQPHTAFISIGSNMGDKLDHCRNAIAALSALEGVTIIGRAPFYKTSPVDYLEQDWFVNTAVQVSTELEPSALLAELQRIQQEAGRVAREIRFGPRTIDLDIIFFDDRIVRTEELEIPHPRMHKRRFVLKPICDIEPETIHPGLGRTVRELLETLDDDQQRIEPFP